MGTTSIVGLSLIATVLSTYIASPYTYFRKTIVTNYVADIVAPIGGASEEAAEEETAPAVEEGYRYNSPTEAATTIQRKKGWGAFYRGVHAEPLLILCYRGLYVFASVLVPQTWQVGHPYLLSRGLALVADVVTQPLEVVSRRLALTASADETEAPYAGVWDCFQTIRETEGVTALWSGLKFRILMSFMSMTVRILYAITVGEE
ncbi:ADP/ATP mitochondrial carrier-like protein [Angomonas deanei]|uniref:Mitochondrial carrier protein, putative n=1 Tax=Angomonas deanei TaxID=59799 RepID=S9VLC8_9TRYP|nr:ADP/ATP mitochondrial carrier-like protein [Angomonas deanei]EPY41598.1 ADP/ATP mitochondrial carrier-like protein [Angomonas deanei]CAD2219333.1 Mitochondrial carrier protein, putative [Angomonas deanei]|eukprot:EPY41553.1 ADP/ATP mitochondrial carrier-like protein [Angomonas deanei]